MFSFNSYTDNIIIISPFFSLNNVDVVSPVILPFVQVRVGVGWELNGRSITFISATIPKALFCNRSNCFLIAMGTSFAVILIQNMSPSVGQFLKMSTTWGGGGGGEEVLAIPSLNSKMKCGAFTTTFYH